MANDMQKIIVDQNIKHGTVVTLYDKKNFYFQNDYVINKPEIVDIENKYDDRFDDISYYFIGTNNIIVS